MGMWLIRTPELILLQSIMGMWLIPNSGVDTATKYNNGDVVDPNFMEGTKS